MALQFRSVAFVKGHLKLQHYRYVVIILLLLAQDILVYLWYVCLNKSKHLHALP